jgi:hypothetical protein
MQKNVIITFQLVLLICAISVFAQNRNKDNALEMVGRLGSHPYESLAKDSGVSFLFVMQPFDRPQCINVGIINHSHDTIILEKSSDGAMFLQIDTVVEGASYIKKRLNWYPNIAPFIERSKSDLTISPGRSIGFPIPLYLSAIHEGKPVSLFITMKVQTNRGELVKKEKNDFVYCESLCTSLVDTLSVLSDHDGLNGNNYSDVLKKAIGNHADGLAAIFKKYNTVNWKVNNRFWVEIRNSFISDFRAGQYKINVKFIKVLSEAGMFDYAFPWVMRSGNVPIDSIIIILTRLESQKHKITLSCRDRYLFFLDMLSLSLEGALGGGEVRVSYEEPKKALDTLEKYFPNANETAEAYFTYTIKVGCGDEAGLDLEGRNDIYQKIIRINSATISSDTIRYLMCASYLQCGHMMDSDPKKACMKGLELINQNLPYIKNDKIRKDVVLLQNRYNEIFKNH